MRLLWAQTEASGRGTGPIPAARCEPKPVQQIRPAGVTQRTRRKALERVARSYDGWFPLAWSSRALGTDIEELRKLVTEVGRAPDSVSGAPLIDPGSGTLSVDTLTRYQEAGVDGVVVFSQKMGAEISDGKAHEWLDCVAPIADRVQGVWRLRAPQLKLVPAEELKVPRLSSMAGGRRPHKAGLSLLEHMPPRALPDRGRSRTGSIARPPCQWPK